MTISLVTGSRIVVEPQEKKDPIKELINESSRFVKSLKSKNPENEQDCQSVVENSNRLLKQLRETWDVENASDTYGSINPELDKRLKDLSDQIHEILEERFPFSPTLVHLQEKIENEELGRKVEISIWKYSTVEQLKKAAIKALNLNQRTPISLKINNKICDKSYSPLAKDIENCVEVYFSSSQKIATKPLKIEAPEPNLDKSTLTQVESEKKQILSMNTKQSQSEKGKIQGINSVQNSVQERKPFKIQVKEVLECDEYVKGVRKRAFQDGEILSVEYDDKTTIRQFKSAVCKQLGCDLATLKINNLVCCRPEHLNLPIMGKLKNGMSNVQIVRLVSKLPSPPQNPTLRPPIGTGRGEKKAKILLQV